MVVLQLMRRRERTLKESAAAAKEESVAREDQLLRALGARHIVADVTYIQVT